MPTRGCGREGTRLRCPCCMDGECVPIRSPLMFWSSATRSLKASLWEVRADCHFPGLWAPGESAPGLETQTLNKRLGCFTEAVRKASEGGCGPCHHLVGFSDGLAHSLVSMPRSSARVGCWAGSTFMEGKATSTASSQMPQALTVAPPDTP